MIITQETPGSPIWKLEREASRGLAILDRHASKSPVIASFEHSLRPTAQRFLELRQQVYRAEHADSLDLREANRSLVDAVTLLRSWVRRLNGDVPGVELGKFRQLEVPEDAVIAGENLLGFVKQLQESGKAPAYADNLVQTVTEALANLKQETQEAQDGMAHAQELRAEARELGVKLHRELVSFRRVLRTVLGSSHRDYQRMRSAQISHEDDEDEILEAIETDPDEPVSTSAATPAVEEVAAE